MRVKGTEAGQRANTLKCEPALDNSGPSLSRDRHISQTNQEDKEAHLISPSLGVFGSKNSPAINLPKTSALINQIKSLLLCCLFFFFFLTENSSSFSRSLKEFVGMAVML